MPTWRGGDRRPGAELGGAPVPWLNAFDVRDFVALVHPLGNFCSGELRAERAHNPSVPHAIQDYLADRDVARPSAGCSPVAPLVTAPGDVDRPRSPGSDDFLRNGA